MAKPILYQISPFDANMSHTFTFSWSGDMVYKNRLTIYDADSLSVVYDKIVSTYVLSHTLPAYTLTNGTKYIAQCQVFDKYDEASSLSDKVFFCALETPVFEFQGLPAGNKIDSATYSATVTYSQANDESIRYYRFYLYDSLKNQVVESDEMYDQTSITYTYRGMETDSTYYFRCAGITMNGMDLDTGYVEVLVSYQSPSSYAIIYAENDPLKGYIKYYTNIIVVQYNGNDVFNYEDGKIDLTDGQVLYYDDGFNIEDDFTLKIRGDNLWQSADIFEARNGDGYWFKISSYIYDDSLRYKLTAFNGLCNYVIYSDALNFSDNDMVTVEVKRIDDIYQIYTFIGDGG